MGNQRFFRHIAFPPASGYSEHVEKVRRILAIPVVFWGLLTGCNRAQPTAVLDFQVGEKATNPPLTYSVIETGWKTQLGEGFKIRTPQNRFLVLRVSVTNGGGSELGLPLFSISGAGGMEYRELDNGEGLEGWLGLLRSVAPAQTMQGTIVFDVPLATYKIRLPNGAPTGEEKWIQVALPLRLDGDQTVQGPNVGVGLK